MYNLLKNICELNGWSFTYARRDYQNLFDEEPVATKSYVFLDPVNKTEVYGTYNNVVESQYNGTFMILASSDIDDADYDLRYQKYIKPIIDGDLKKIKESFGCNGKLTINSWQEVEVINALDWTADGVIVTYSISERV